MHEAADAEMHRQHGSLRFAYAPYELQLQRIVSQRGG